jgi:PAS domain-containing protein
LGSSIEGEPYLTRLDLTIVTGARRVEAALLSGEPSYRLIVDTIPAPIATMTSQGEVEHVNRQVYEYFGCAT